MVDDVQYFRGATYVINEYAPKNKGITLGNYININDESSKPANSSGKFNPLLDDLYLHEYGHYLQSQEYGWGYLFSVGLPSLRSAKRSEPIDGHAPLTTHKIKWYERYANEKASNYFSKKMVWIGMLIDFQ